LLRLLLPLDDQVCTTSSMQNGSKLPTATVRGPH